jgi:hypothetical protein
MKTVKDVLVILGLVLVSWVILALIEALPHAAPVMIGK